MGVWMLMKTGPGIFQGRTGVNLSTGIINRYSRSILEHQRQRQCIRIQMQMGSIKVQGDGGQRKSLENSRLLPFHDKRLV